MLKTNGHAILVIDKNLDAIIEAGRPALHHGKRPGGLAGRQR